MAATLHDDVFDSGLNVITTGADILHVCSSQPANFAGIAAVALGTAAPSVGSPVNGASSGRRVIVATITDGSVTTTGTAGFYAISNSGASKMYGAQALSGTQAVTSGNIFTLDAISITLPDPA